MRENSTIKFWGVRGSYPTPGTDTVRYGGNTSCVEVCLGEESIILDAGTGIIPLGRELVRRAAQRRKALNVTLLLSHLHHDHTQGFPFFVPAYMPTAHVQIFGHAPSNQILERVLESNQSPQTFPIGLSDMAARKTIRAVRETEEINVMAGDAKITTASLRLAEEAVRIRIHHSYAHPGGVHIYRLEWRDKSIVYATDTEGYVDTDRRLVEFSRGADMLIHDAQYTQAHYRGQSPGALATQGYGHSTVEMACEVAAAAEVKQLVLFHHDPSYDDEAIAQSEAHAQTLFEKTLAAREGLQLDLGRNTKRVALAPTKEVSDRAMKRM